MCFTIDRIMVRYPPQGDAARSEEVTRAGSTFSMIIDYNLFAIYYLRPYSVGSTIPWIAQQHQRTGFEMGCSSWETQAFCHAEPSE